MLGLTPMQSFRRIVLPQAIRMTLPPLASNFVQLIKFSSLGAVISVSEITRRGMELVATNFRPLETFTFIAVVYFFICWPLAMAIRCWERRLARPASHDRRACAMSSRRRVDGSLDAADRDDAARWSPSPRPIRRATPTEIARVAEELLREIPGIEVDASSRQPRHRQPGRPHARQHARAGG